MKKNLTLLLLVFLQFTAFSQVSLLKDIIPGAGSSNPSNFTNVNGTLYFTADDGISGVELYKSNNTTAGTNRFKDIIPGAESSYPTGLVNLNGKLLFAATSVSNGRELWISNGTAAGTTILKDIVPGAGSSSPYRIIVAGSYAYFFVDDASSVICLWRTDGTAAGTVLVKKFPGYDYFYPPVTANGIIYFNSEQELWKSDGAAAGTSVVATIPGSIVYLKAFKGNLYFGTWHEGYGLWVSNGTAVGTKRISDVLVWGPEFTPMGNYLYFAGSDEDGTGRELWRTNGTPEGTTIVKDLNTEGDGISWYYRNGTAATKNLVFFAGSDASGERTLYKSNGTAAGTVKINNAPTFGEEEEVFVESTTALVYFTHGNSLWKTDGTEAGTTMIKTFTTPVVSMGRVYSVLYICGSTAKNGFETWKYVPTATATTTVENPKSVAPIASLGDKVSVYPNSFKTSTQISVSAEDLVNENISVKILNLRGKVLSNYQMKAGESIEVGSELPAGTFLLQLKSESGKAISKVIIKE